MPYATWWQRVGSALVDGLVPAPFTVLGAVLATAGTHGRGTNGGLLAGAAVCYLGAVAAWVWSSVVRQGRTGASVGKQALGICLLAEPTGQPLGSWTAFVRNLAHVLDALPCYLGYLWPLWDARRQTFADKLVGSVVLRTAGQVRPGTG